jgi:hypothetical protein
LADAENEMCRLAEAALQRHHILRGGTVNVGAAASRHLGEAPADGMKLPNGRLAGENEPAPTPTLARESPDIVGFVTVNTTSRAADSFLSSN